MTTLETLVRSYFSAFNAGDKESLLSLLSDDIIHDINQGDREIGKEHFAAFRSHMDECYLEQITDLVVMVGGGRATAEFTCSGTYLKTDGSLPPASGQNYSLPCVAIFEEREGLISRITSYYNLRDWISMVSS
ncbi:MAG: nuclear transport factor 2 family protein [Fimbriimonadaceae bacterium]|jgi:steroid delta-isomerase-like uncharacterized protein|nr:nuclear transport factor 2 family protein [Fimbriimonadaceae bacterium]